LVVPLSTVAMAVFELDQMVLALFSTSENPTVSEQSGGEVRLRKRRRLRFVVALAATVEFTGQMRR